MARLLGMTGAVGGLTWTLVAVGLVLEYMVWTTGLGAAALVRFGRQTPAQPVAQTMIATS